MLAIKKLILHVFYVNDILVTLLYLITTYHFREKCLYMYWYLYKLSYSINIYYYMQGRFLWMIVYQQVICSTSVWIIRFREEMRVFLWNRSAEKRCKLHCPVIHEGHTASHWYMYVRRYPSHRRGVSVCAGVCRCLLTSTFLSGLY